MYNYRKVHFFVDNTTCYSTTEKLKSGAIIQEQILKDIVSILQILEQHNLFFAQKVILYARKTRPFKDIEISINSENITSSLSFLLTDNKDGCIGLSINGYSLIKNGFGQPEKILDCIALDVRFDERTIHLEFDTKNWLPLFIERKNGIADYNWHLNRFNQNKGRLEAAFIEIEAATNMLQEYSPNFDRGEYDDGFVMQGRSIYVPRHIFEEAIENQPFSIEVDIADYLAPKEALDFFNDKIPTDKNKQKP